MHPHTRARSIAYPAVSVNTTCTILDRFAPTAYHAVLPNGKITVAFLQRREAEQLGTPAPGEKVRVTICPADFERARICARA